MKNLCINFPETAVVVLDNKADTIITGVLLSNTGAIALSAQIRTVPLANLLPAGQIISGGGNTTVVEGVDITTAPNTNIFLPVKITVRKGGSLLVDGGGNVVSLLC